MFRKLRNRIIVITMTITTAVLILAGVFIVLFSSTMRPEPKLRLEPDYTVLNPVIYDNQELKDYIKTDREEGSVRLLVTLIAVGAIVEVVVFIIVYNLSRKIVEPVKDSYDKQKMFIANASHELKTPLAIMQANMEAIDVSKENEKWKVNIENEITHANKLVLDLLQLAKMDAGSVDRASNEEVDLDSAITERIEMFGPKFSGKISFDKRVKDTKRVLRKQDFLQTLDILLDNATKYGKKKIVVVLGQNEIAVVNDGATIEKKDLEKVFDRFYQIDKTKEGSGLGLAIAKAVCEQNNWQIICESGKNITKFIIRF